MLIFHHTEATLYPDSYLCYPAMRFGGGSEDKALENEVDIKRLQY